MKPLLWVVALLLPTSLWASSLDAYKSEVARHIVRANKQHVFEGTVPPLLKSIVVLEVTIDSRGTAHARVVRSNGFKELENRAIESVRRAGPFASPPHERAVSYLETFLFRDDGRFRVRSLVDS